MHLGFLAPAMLWGLLAASVPLILHLWSRRRREVVDWGAMMFLTGDSGTPPRSRLALSEWALLALRMGLLGTLALALARPAWTASGIADASGKTADRRPMLEATRPEHGRTTVLVVDDSLTMERRINGVSLRERARRWMRRLVERLGSGHSIALVRMGARSENLIDPPTTDRDLLNSALALPFEAAGTNNLGSGLVEAFRILEGTPVDRADVVVLTDGQRRPWRIEEQARWSLVRELWQGINPRPKLWAVTFSADPARVVRDEEPDAALGPLALSRPLVGSGQQFTATATLFNGGPTPLTRGVELLIDGRTAPVAVREVGPVPPGGRFSVSLGSKIAAPGTHEVRLRLVGGEDSNPIDDETADLISVVDGLEVLLVEGDPSQEPLQGSADFLHAALALPSGGDPDRIDPRSPFHVTVTPHDRLTRGMLITPRIVILSNVAALDHATASSLDRFVTGGGGLMIVLGDRSAASFYDRQEWFPGTLGELRRPDKPDPGQGPAEPPRGQGARPAPATFAGQVMRGFASGVGADSRPPLAEATIGRYRMVEIQAGSRLVVARLDTGDPWIVDRPFGRGRISLVTSPLTSAAGNLVVNPDFVPLVHEWILSLAGTGSMIRREIAPGEPWIIDLDPPPPRSTLALSVRTPSGAMIAVPISRPAEVVDQSGTEREPGPAQVRFDRTDAPGVYRIDLPEPPGGSAGAIVPIDLREADLTPLAALDMETLTAGWPLNFEPEPDRFLDRLLSHVGESFSAGDSTDRGEFWRLLVLAVLVVLCVETWAARRFATGL